MYIFILRVEFARWQNWCASAADLKHFCKQRESPFVVLDPVVAIVVVVDIAGLIVPLLLFSLVAGRLFGRCHHIFRICFRCLHKCTRSNAYRFFSASSVLLEALFAEKMEKKRNTRNIRDGMNRFHSLRWWEKTAHKCTTFFDRVWHCYGIPGMLNTVGERKSFADCGATYRGERGR